MRFISVRDLRGKASEIWRTLEEEKELIITSNGRPIAILSSASEETLEQHLAALRRARALSAVTSIQRASVEKGTDRIPRREIDEEIRRVRKSRGR